MEQRQYVQVRVSADTHKRLTSVLNELRRDAVVRPDDYLPGLSQGKVGLSDAIDQLIFARDTEKVRKRSYKDAKRNPRVTVVPPHRRGEIDRMADDGCPNVE